MNPLGFKRSVLVYAVTMKVIGHHEGDTDRYKIHQAKDLPWFDHRAEGDWPGEPVLLDWDVPKGPFDLEPSPNGQAVVRFRRYHLDEARDGVVIGSTWRQEGVIADGTLLGPRRSISLYEVALRPPLRATRSLVVLVHPRDLETLDDNSGSRGVPSPNRVGVGGGGRLGGI